MSFMIIYIFVCNLFMVSLVCADNRIVVDAVLFSSSFFLHNAKEEEETKKKKKRQSSQMKKSY